MPKTSVSRRDFARAAAALAAAAAVLPNDLLAQTPPPPTAAAPPAAPPPVNQADIDARINFVMTRYGSRLTDEQKADVRRIITGGQGGLDAIRAFPLNNSVQPMLSPVRLRDKRSKA